jgi:hypothetical protein
MTTPQAGWYDDPEVSNAQRYWDGQDWTPHRQRKPISQTTSPSGEEYPPPRSGEEYPPPPPGEAYPPPPPGRPPQRSGNSTAIIAIIGLVAVLAVAGSLVYKFVWKHNSTSAPTSSATAAPTAADTDAPTHSAPGSPRHSGPGGPTHSAPGGSTGGGESKYLSDLSAVGITSSTARPEALVAKGHQACSDLAAGQSQDQAAANIVSRSNHFFDETSAENIVRFAIQDLCPQ